MKNTIFTLASIATLVGSAQAQYLDNLEVSGPPVDASTTAPTGVTTTIFGWTDATLGKVTATYAGALLRGASDSYISTSADGSGRFGF